MTSRERMNRIEKAASLMLDNYSIPFIGFIVSELKKKDFVSNAQFNGVMSAFKSMAGCCFDMEVAAGSTNGASSSKMVTLLRQLDELQRGL